MEEVIKIFKNCWVMTTDHVLDDQNQALKLAIINALDYIDRTEHTKKLACRI